MKRIVPYVLVFALGLGVGYMVSRYIPATASISQQVLRENSPEYKFINPILLAQSNQDTKSSQYKSLQSAVNQYINHSKDEMVSTISVYFRDMNSGAWTGVNETDTYAPGSMLKVAILLGYLNAEVEGPGLLDTTYSYNPQIDEGQYFKPATMLKPGKHTARDLIKNMIIESDNTATLILANQHPDIIEKVYKDLNLPDPQVGADFMSPLQYASFWRVLYNATFLPRAESEEALELLSLTTFNDGLVAGLPSGVRVAHKFGEHTDVVDNKPAVRELHDCGIVYPDNNKPYFLCVMTRGSSFEPLEKAIADISSLVYKQVTQ